MNDILDILEESLVSPIFIYLFIDLILSLHQSNLLSYLNNFLIFSLPPKHKNPDNHSPQQCRSLWSPKLAKPPQLQTCAPEIVSFLSMKLSSATWAAAAPD